MCSGMTSAFTLAVRASEVEEVEKVCRGVREEVEARGGGEMHEQRRQQAARAISLQKRHSSGRAEPADPPLSPTKFGRRRGP